MPEDDVDEGLEVDGAVGEVAGDDVDGEEADGDAVDGEEGDGDDVEGDEADVEAGRTIPARGTGTQGHVPPRIARVEFIREDRCPGYVALRPREGLHESRRHRFPTASPPASTPIVGTLSRLLRMAGERLLRRR